MKPYSCTDLASCILELKKQGALFDAQENDENGKTLSAALKAPDGQMFRLMSGYRPRWF
jgi:hypothetical protein